MLSRLQLCFLWSCGAFLALTGVSVPAKAQQIVVSHDINTLAYSSAGANEATFAVNVADFLTKGHATKNLLLFESAPTDGLRNYAPSVLTKLTGAGFSVTVTNDYTTPFAAYDAIFTAERNPIPAFLDNTTLIDYANNGGGIYLAGGVSYSAATESAGWNTFLNHFGLEFAPVYNSLNTVSITSSDPIFTGVTSLSCANGSPILDLGTNPNARIVQSVGSDNVYALVSSRPAVTVAEPGTVALVLSVSVTGAGFLARRKRGHKAV